MGRTQALITEQPLDEFRNSLVLVVGLLGQRFGTATDSYESGTEEEFATAIRFRKEQGKWPEIKWIFHETWNKQGPPKIPKQLMEASLQWQKILDFSGFHDPALIVIHNTQLCLRVVIPAGMPVSSAMDGSFQASPVV